MTWQHHPRLAAACCARCSDVVARRALWLAADVDEPPESFTGRKRRAFALPLPLLLDSDMIAILQAIEQCGRLI